MGERYEVMMRGCPPWGFRLAGGADVGQPISISRVTPGSLASESGLSDGDLLLFVDGFSTNGVTHLDAQSMVKQAGSGGQLRLTLSRSSPGWRPQSNFSTSAGQQEFGNSSAQSRQSGFRQSVGPGFNKNPPQNKPTVMGGAPTVAHLQYNSPVNLYSAGNIYETFKGQTQGIVNDAQFVGSLAPQGHDSSSQPQYQQQSDITQSATYKFLQQEKQYQPPAAQNQRSFQSHYEPEADSHTAQSRSFKRLQHVVDPSDSSSGGYTSTASIKPVVQSVAAPGPRPGFMQPAAGGPRMAGQQRPGAGSYNQPQFSSGPSNFASVPVQFNSSGPRAPGGAPSGGGAWVPPAARHSNAAAPNAHSNARQTIQSAIPGRPRAAEPLGSKPAPAGLASPTGTSGPPVCQACNEIIRGPFVTAVGKNWHPDCFKCVQCSVSLQDAGFVEENHQLLCERCYNEGFAPLCAKCNDRIAGDVLHAVEKTWHTDCFVCTHCKCPFGNTGFHLEDGLPYCEHDWNELFTSKCHACNNAIQAGHRWLEALNVNWHADCFKCTVCMKKLEGETFFSKQGRPYCREHNR